MRGVSNGSLLAEARPVLPSRRVRHRQAAIHPSLDPGVRLDEWVDVECHDAAAAVAAAPELEAWHLAKAHPEWAPPLMLAAPRIEALCELLAVRYDRQALACVPHAQRLARPLGMAMGALALHLQRHHLRGLGCARPRVHHQPLHHCHWRCLRTRPGRRPHPPLRPRGHERLMRCLYPTAGPPPRRKRQGSLIRRCCGRRHCVRRRRREAVRQEALRTCITTAGQTDSPGNVAQTLHRLQGVRRTELTGSSRARVRLRLCKTRQVPVSALVPRATRRLVACFAHPQTCRNCVSGGWCAAPADHWAVAIAVVPVCAKGDVLRTAEHIAQQLLEQRLTRPNVESCG